MSTYQEAFRALNAAQKQAVITTEGPVLVIAGPGTGKTQLLTTRIAHILQATDTLPQNILCLTFTESGAQTMRERLTGMIGQAAYDITISTYHAFGSDLIRRYPDYFNEYGEGRPIDDLAADTIFRDIIAGLPYTNPLTYAENYIGDIRTLVSDAKRALLTPADLHKIAYDNETFLSAASPIVAEVLQDFLRMGKKSIPLLQTLSTRLDAFAEAPSPIGNVTPLAQPLLQELHEALAYAEQTGKTTELTKWKNTWLVKDTEGHFVLDGGKANHKLHAGADIYEQYLTELAARGLFDYDDMILRAIDALQRHADLRYTLQEQYLYILLDEFQDTNGAQLKLVELLTNNPASEGRPNVLAVGDDDQAIYAFQGADYSHMLQFKQMYRDVLAVPLTENYRSHPDILHTARGIAEQIEERLHHHFPEIEKTLTAAGTHLPTKAIVERRDAKSDVAQLAWVAKQIKKIIAAGTPANEIAVLAPQHKYLEPLVPFLRQAGVPVRYEKRENILDDGAINQLLRMSELCLALANGHHQTANALWAEVLSFDFWELPTSLIWGLSWQANDDHESWTEVLLKNEQLRPYVLFFIRLSFLVGTETLESVLDYLIGVTPLDLGEPGYDTFSSPFYAYHFGAVTEPSGQTSQTISLFDQPDRQKQQADFWNLLTNLTVLRARLRDYQKEEGELLRLQDFITFVEAHRRAGIKILNTSPYQEAEKSVQLMTAFKAKGQEYEAVFVLAVNDEVWGSKARSQSTRLSLPRNLQFIRYAGATNDERLRLFYVALTRAKSQLYLVHYMATYAGKRMTRLKYLSEIADEDKTVSPLLPPSRQQVLSAEENANMPTTELAAYWQQRHTAAISESTLRALLTARLERFQLSPTHVNSFIDLEKQGPAYFYMNTILRFPKAPSPHGEFGNAMHETLEWIHRHRVQEGALPSATLALQTFERTLRSKRLSEHFTLQFMERAGHSLRAYLQQRAHTVDPANQVEFNFRNEGVFIGKAHMSGKIDKLIIDKASKTIQIVDFKTGKSFSRWQPSTKLHRYRQQLYLYKALVEGSHTFAGYTVTGGYLEFVEPDEDGRIQELALHFDDAELAQAKQLARGIWECIMALDIPDVSTYSADLAGIQALEQDIIRRTENE